MEKRPAEEHIRLFTARVLREDGRPEGSGFLVGRRLVVTCAHVVAAAQAGSDVAGLSSTVRVDFPLLHPGAVHSASVTSWQPEEQDGSGDIAVLRLDRSPSQRLHPATLVDGHSVWKHGFITFGFPSGLDEGVWAHGELLSRQAGGWIQLESVRTTGHRVQRGFSGAPVWDETVRGVVGMVVASEREAATRGAYVVAAKALTAASGVQLVALPDGAAAPACRVEIDGILTRRRAHRFGFRLALLARAESLSGGSHQDQALAAWTDECADHADYLDVPFAAAAAPALDRTETLVARVHQARTIMAALAQRYGAGAGDGFYLGFQIALAPEMVPQFDAHERSRLARDLERQAESAGLPPDVVAAVGDLVARDSSPAGMLDGIFEMDARICAEYNNPLRGSAWLRQVQANVWGFAANAALAALGHSAGAGAEPVDRLLGKAVSFAEELDLDVPALPPLTGDSVSDDVAALHYVLDELTDGLADRLRFRYGPPAVQLLRLCTRMYALLILYSPGASEASSVAKTIGDAGGAAALPPELTADLLAALAAGAPYDAIKSEVSEVDQRVARWLRA